MESKFSFRQVNVLELETRETIRLPVHLPVVGLCFCPVKNIRSISVTEKLTMSQIGVVYMFAQFV